MDLCHTCMCVSCCVFLKEPSQPQSFVRLKFVICHFLSTRKSRVIDNPFPSEFYPEILIYVFHCWFITFVNSHSSTSNPIKQLKLCKSTYNLQNDRKERLGWKRLHQQPVFRDSSPWGSLCSSAKMQGYFHLWGKTNARAKFKSKEKHFGKHILLFFHFFFDCTCFCTNLNKWKSIFVNGEV